MIPLFKTHSSIGRSILRNSDVKRISENYGLDEVYFVEDSMVGFPEAFRTFGQKLRFGLRFSIFNDSEDESSESKMIAFASGDKGCQDLYKLYTQSFDKKLVDPWNEFKNLMFVVPFYDSFAHKNLVGFTNCMPNLPDEIPFLLEDNGLPFDQFITASLKKSVDASPKRSFVKAKSIYYEFKEDVEAFQTYKCICNRQPGRQASLSSPRLDHFGSDRFCIQSWKEEK